MNERYIIALDDALNGQLQRDETDTLAISRAILTALVHTLRGDDHAAEALIGYGPNIRACRLIRNALCDYLERDS